MSNYDGKVVNDSLGREITLRKPKPMDRYDLAKLLNKDAQIESCLSMMLPILYVAKIDDYVFSKRMSFEECAVQLNILQDEGAEAVAKEIIDSRESQQEAVENIKK